MNKKGIERNIIALLFVLVLIAFSFAQRDSQKLEKLYTTAATLKKAPQTPTVMASPSKPSNNN
ncbi:MAG TPA: hypothetical protein VMR70_19255 [Flavisolibacter sp.]|nr:hypothetical protein [Flavisolibacter sp.]